MYFVLIIFIWLFLSLERIIWVSIISYGEIRFDTRMLWITSSFPERIMLANQGTTVFKKNFKSERTSRGLFPIVRENVEKGIKWKKKKGQEERDE
jgi:hypothetical protein